MRTMYDSVSPSGIPAGAELVAGYVDGRYANVAAMKERFPKARVVTIAVSSKTRAMVLDVEPGDASPATAVTWCTTTMAETDNSRLTVYCQASTVPAVKAAFKAAGVSLPQFWVAQWDGVHSLPAGAVAKQHTSTKHYDVSVVADHWPGVDPDKPRGKYEPFPGASWFRKAPHSPIVTAMGRRLVAEGCGRPYKVGPGPQWTDADQDAFRLWQKRLGDPPQYCDGWPGPKQWDALRVPRV